MQMITRDVLFVGITIILFSTGHWIGAIAFIIIGFILDNA
jgi:hypothetical protein